MKTRSAQIEPYRSNRMRLYVLLTIGLWVGACGSTNPERLAGRQPAYRIIAYVGGRADLYGIDAAKLTHINYAFGQVSTDGRVVLENENAPAHLAQLQALKARNPDLKILLSVGGWGADNFSDAALTDSSRDVFARSAVEMVKRYGLDGIDLDWEYPGQPGPGIKYRPEDKENFTLMLKAVREGLDQLSDERGRAPGDRYLLTIASAGGTYFEHTEMDKLHTYLDWINIMTYDMFGSWTERTGHHTGLYPSSEGFAPLLTSEAYVQQHLEAGIPPEKLVLGAAFYGRGWTGVEPANNGLNQPFERYTAAYPYTVLVQQYIDKRGFRRHWDDRASAPYLWNPDSTTFITYEDPQSLREKARFVKTHGLGGIMYWEQSHDPRQELLGAIYDALR